MEVTMLTFTYNSQGFPCGEEGFPIVKKLIEGITKIIVSNQMKTLAGDFTDDIDDLNDNIFGLLDHTDEGLVFDVENKLGAESYGNVYGFFESYIRLLKDIKKEFPQIGIYGNIEINQFGIMDFVHERGIYTTSSMKEVEITMQQQCIHCHKWVNSEQVFRSFNEDFFEEIDFDDEDIEAFFEDISMSIENTYNGVPSVCICKSCKDIPLPQWSTIENDD